MNRLESSKQCGYLPVNRRVDGSTQSSTNPASVAWQTLAAACFCLLALTCAPGTKAAAQDPPKPPVTITVCASGCDQTSIAAAVAAAKNDDTIAIGAGTYVGTIEVSKNLTLRGVSARETIIDGAGENNSLVIIDSGATVSLQNLTVQRGGSYNALTRGSILVQGTLTVTDCIITDNFVGISNDGGIIKVIRSAITKNRPELAYADLAGGIVNFAGQTALFDSSVSDNVGNAVGGISVFTGALSLSNSTVSANVGSNISVDNGAILSLTNSTVVNTGRWGSIGLAPGAQVVVGNSILSSPGPGANCWTQTGSTILSLGHNLSSDNTCFLTDPTDLNSNANIKLGPLQVNAPGLTETHALLAGSAAIDAGNCAGGLTRYDQRGVSRPQGPACDIGAFELRTPIANNDAYAAIAGRTLVVPAPGVLTNDVSPDGPPLSVYSASTPTHGSVSFFSLGTLLHTQSGLRRTGLR